MPLPLPPPRFNSSRLAPLIVHPSLLRCEPVIQAFVDQGLVRIASSEESRREERNDVQTRSQDCRADCLGAGSKSCQAHFCECPKGRAGAFCQSRVAEERRWGVDDSVLTFQVRERERG